MSQTKNKNRGQSTFPERPETKHILGLADGLNALLSFAMAVMASMRSLSFVVVVRASMHSLSFAVAVHKQPRAVCVHEGGRVPRTGS